MPCKRMVVDGTEVRVNLGKRGRWTKADEEALTELVRAARKQLGLKKDDAAESKKGGSP